MTRATFDKELAKLQEKLLDLGAIVERTLPASVEILKAKEFDAARKLIAEDMNINRKRFAIETEALVLIARQQPMAVDLRTIAAVLEIATELERIADYSKGIAKVTLRLESEPLIKPLVDIPRMAEKAADMLRRALASFTARDVEAARDIAGEDPEMDDLYQQVYRELMTYVIADPRNIDGANRLMWVAHNLERAADRVVNICERVIFTVTGELLELDKAGENPA